MPELPDVETFRRTVCSTSLHRPVREVEVREPRVLGNTTRPQFTRRVRGAALEGTHRHGKLLFVALDEKAELAFHFGMTAEPVPYRDRNDAPEHARVILAFEKGGFLAYDSQRMLGRIDYVRDRAAYLRAHDVGPDAFRMPEKTFVGLLLDHRGGLKSFLMDQSRLAGIGNVYADEILFRSRFAPRRRSATLDRKGAERVHEALQTIVRMAIRRKARRERFPRSWLTPQRRKDAPRCPRGCGELTRGTVNGRSTYWCPSCQT